MIISTNWPKKAFFLSATVLIGSTSGSLNAAESSDPTPLSGTLDCQVTYRHMIPKSADARAFVMVTNAKCHIQGLSAEASHIYSMSLDFDEKGKGQLLSGSGVSLIDQKPVNSILMTEADYILEFDKGAVVGWHATGELLWTSGPKIGKTAKWNAQATGPDSLTINYKSSE